MRESTETVLTRGIEPWNRDSMGNAVVYLAALDLRRGRDGDGDGDGDGDKEAAPVIPPVLDGTDEARAGMGHAQGVPWLGLGKFVSASHRIQGVVMHVFWRPPATDPESSVSVAAHMCRMATRRARYAVVVVDDTSEAMVGCVAQVWSEITPDADRILVVDGAADAAAFDAAALDPAPCKVFALAQGWELSPFNAVQQYICDQAQAQIAQVDAASAADPPVYSMRKVMVPVVG